MQFFIACLFILGITEISAKEDLYQDPYTEVRQYKVKPRKVVVKTPKANIYADPELSFAIGYVPQGKKISIGRNFKIGKGLSRMNVYETFVYGKLAYIKAKDLFIIPGYREFYDEEIVEDENNNQKSNSLQSNPKEAVSSYIQGDKERQGPYQGEAWAHSVGAEYRLILPGPFWKEIAKGLGEESTLLDNHYFRGLYQLTLNGPFTIQAGLSFLSLMGDKLSLTAYGPEFGLTLALPGRSYDVQYDISNSFIFFPYTSLTINGTSSTGNLTGWQISLRRNQRFLPQWRMIYGLGYMLLTSDKMLEEVNNRNLNQYAYSDFAIKGFYFLINFLYIF